jgi:protein ImuB
MMRGLDITTKTRGEMYACLYAREFPAQAVLRLRPELRGGPVVVVEGEAPLETVCSLNAKARTSGVAREMTRVELETFEGLRVVKRSKVEEASAHAVMLECAGGFTPRVEDRSEGKAFLCVLDIAGTEKLLGRPEVLAKELLRRVQRLGVSASVAVSRNFHAAMCCVRGTSARVRLVAAGEEGAALSGLPLRVLDLSEAHAETFGLWGIRTLGALAALPETQLIARMGQEGKRLRLMARGEFPHHFVPYEAAFVLQERMELDTPVEVMESLMFVVGMMLEQVIVRASARVLALASVSLTLELEGGGAHVRRVRPALPTNDRGVWLKLLHLDLEAHAPEAAVVAVTLDAEPGSTSKVQLGLFSPQLPEPMRLDVTLARIRAVVGEECVGSPVLKDTHGADGFRMEDFKVGAQGSLFETRMSPTAMRQLRPPERVRVSLRERRPVGFCFRETRYVVEKAYGPWLAEGDWWSGVEWVVEQWDLIARDERGGVLCCCVVNDRKTDVWQMVTLYD